MQAARKGQGHSPTTDSLLEDGKCTFRAPWVGLASTSLNQQSYIL